MSVRGIALLVCLVFTGGARAVTFDDPLWALPLEVHSFSLERTSLPDVHDDLARALELVADTPPGGTYFLWSGPRAALSGRVVRLMLADSRRMNDVLLPFSRADLLSGAYVAVEPDHSSTLISVLFVDRIYEGEPPGSPQAFVRLCVQLAANFYGTAQLYLDQLDPAAGIGVRVPPEIGERAIDLFLSHVADTPAFGRLDQATRAAFVAARVAADDAGADDLAPTKH